MTEAGAVSLPWPPAAERRARDETLGLLDRYLALCFRGVLPADRCAEWTRGAYAARERWINDWDGEQFSLGRAWYTHFEQDRVSEYFRGADASDQSVERAAPGAQRFMMEVIASVTGGEVVRRRGWCGPGMHIFPAHEKVSRVGGVLHFDTEGLPKHSIERRKAALSFVVMLQPPASGGGLKVWDVRYRGRDHPTAKEEAAPSRILEYGVGDLIVQDSFRLHQIQPFDGDVDRVSLTAMACEVDTDRWEVWF